jgi:hypothetical protein
MPYCGDRIPGLLRVLLPVLIIAAAAEPAGATAVDGNPALTDSLYEAHHPRLLFTPAEAAALYTKVRDGGHNDDAYAFIRNVAVNVYPGYSMEDLLDDDYALNPIPNLGLAAYLESKPDAAALALGRQITLYVADNYGVDNDSYGSSLRLRQLALGYDMFFGDSSESERDYLRSEIVSYLDYMTGNFNYGIWRYRPYLGNKTMMIASSLGLAAICLEGEIHPSEIDLVLDVADDMIDEWLAHQLDDGGAYNEGLVYGSWSMRLLIYYFHARKRHDGVNYAANAQIRSIEKWLAYELLPEGSGAANNLNDCAYVDNILSRHHTYLDWAQAEWGSGLSSWLWDHIAGSDGFDWELEADKAATVLWNQSLLPAGPSGVLPASMMWEDRGLYYFRTGWNTGANSDDVVFSFYSGKFQGAHAQEDQGQFTLYGYGAKFAIDHGPGPASKESEAHNVILIDDRGQHNAGNSIGTDGDIQAYLLSGFADYVAGDQTDAYSTHSQWNDPDVPFPGADWSWGYDGGNPVNYARRRFVVVHDSYIPTYFLLLDDIEKDGSPHLYEWRMHTHDANTVDVSTNPIRITRGSSRLDLHVLEPPFGDVQLSVAPFANDSQDPDASVLSLSVTDTSPHYGLLMIPGDESTRKPTVSKASFDWGYVVTLDWGFGVEDVFVCNPGGETVTYYNGDWYATNATLAVVRSWWGRLVRYLATDVETLVFNKTVYVVVNDGRLSCSLSSDDIQIDRYGADFRFYAPNIDEVYCRGRPVPVISQDGYLFRDPVVSAGERPPAEPSFEATVYPNPFNPSATVRITVPQSADAHAVIYDVGGQPVRTLWRGVLPGGTSTLKWDGADERGNRVASGVYFLRIDFRGESRFLKLVVLK